MYKKYNIFDKYRHWRNKVCSLIKLSKRNYYRQMITDCSGNIGRVWKVLRELSDKQEQINTVPKLKINNTVTDNGWTVVNMFNEYFVKTADRIFGQNEILVSEYKPSLQMLSFTESKIPKAHSFIVPHISTNAVFNYLRNINCKKATGLDNIPGHVIRSLGAELDQ